jgi:hypothetical protein
VTLPPAVLWADPGKMTGMALYYEPVWEKGPVFHADEMAFDPACAEIEKICAYYGEKLAIGWERFDINAGTHKKTQGGTKDAMHMIGVLRHLTRKYSCRFIGEAQQHTPEPHDRRMLEKLGWWTAGKDDAQSAACHLLRWLVNEDELTPAQREALYTGDETA